MEPSRRSIARRRLRYCETVKNVTAGEKSDFERRKRLQKDVIASIREFRAGDRLTREEVHRRAAVR